MTLDFFFNSYDLEELEYQDIYIKDSNLILAVNIPAHLELIANGYRPELDISMAKIFEFKNVSLKDKIFKKPYIVKLIEKKNDSYILDICGEIITIPFQNINIINK